MPHKRNVDKFGATRLARESEKGDLTAVKAAYEAAPEELDQSDFAGIAPLQKAALHGFVDVVDFLLSKGCRTDCESNDRDTPLIDAVENGHLAVVKLLLDKGHVNPHHQNKKGQRAIDVLDPDYQDTEEIEKALKEAMMKQTDVAKNDEDSHPGLTQQRSASTLLYNEYNTETLIEKAGDGDIAAVGELLNSNIKPSIACGVAASRGGHYDILSILLGSGLKADPDPSKHSETPMLVAIGRGHLKIVKLLLEQDNFNPTRRNREGKTYWEISEDRRGPKWEEERDMLKNAYDFHQRTHRSPIRAKKEAPNPSAVRVKRKSSPIKRERSSSPRPDSKRTNPSKSTATTQVPQKGRRLMSGKEMANREVKRRRMVVSEDSTDEESDEDVRPPARKVMAVLRSYSEGEDTKATKKRTKPPRSESNGVRKRTEPAPSNGSDHEPHPKPQPKIRTRTEKVIPRFKPTSTPDAESPDERKPVNKLVKSRVVDGKITKRRASDVAMEDIKTKRTPTTSSKSTPAPPEKASTPEVVRERRQEVDRQAAEAKRKAAEAEARKLEEQEAARKVAEEEEIRKKAVAEAEARRLAEEADAARRKEEEEARRKAEAETKRQEEYAARQMRLSKLPPALRRACELGGRLPLHFSGEELGVSKLFLPLLYATSEQLFPHERCDDIGKSYIMSFQAVGILGLPELDLAQLGPPYSAWKRVNVSRRERELFLLQYDVALLAQPFRFPMEGTAEFDWRKITESVREARQQFLEMEGLYWIEENVLFAEAEMVESLRPLLSDIKDRQKRRQIRFTEPETENTLEKKPRPRKSFRDVVLDQARPNGTLEGAKVNGNG
jgi:ankyrin repeat protein